MEIEGKNLTDESTRQICKLLDENSHFVSVAACVELNKHGIDYEAAPEIWEAVAKSLITLKEILFANDNFKRIVVALAEAGYKDEHVWE